MKKAYSHLGHLNKPVLQVLTVAFGQADEIAVCFAQACILSTGEAYLPSGAALQLKPCTEEWYSRIPCLQAGSAHGSWRFQ